MQFASQGWMVEVQIEMAAKEWRSQFYAVGKDTEKESENAVRSYPGIYDEDKVTAKKRLSDSEISKLRLQPDMVMLY